MSDVPASTPASVAAESDEGRRERKKRETREALQAAALRLFTEHGFGTQILATAG